MSSSIWFEQPSLDLDLSIGPLRFSGVAASPKRLPPAESNHIEKFFIRKEKSEIQFLESALNQANEEKKRLKEMLASMATGYGSLLKKVKDLRANSSDGESISPSSRKRKSVESESLDTAGAPNCLAAANVCVGGPTESTTSSDDDSCKRVRLEDCKPKVSKRYVRTDPSDTTLVVKDGYQWRKNGQKVTRDNPCPRAYFRCSFAPSCAVKKKVQRSAEDKTILVATYEGEHNHGQAPQPSGAPINGSLRKTFHPHNATPAVLELVPSSKSNALPEASASASTNSAESQRGLVEQMAVALTKDPAFREALTMAISGRMFEISPPCGDLGVCARLQVHALSTR